MPCPSHLGTLVQIIASGVMSCLSGICTFSIIPQFVSMLRCQAQTSTHREKNPSKSTESFPSAKSKMAKLRTPMIQS